MADTKRDEQEPSIEEILASIREIISDDEESEGTDRPASEIVPDSKPKAAAAPMSDDDISALFDAPAPAAEPAPAAPAKAAPAKAADEDEIIELTDEVPPSDPLAGINFDKPVQTVDFDEPEEEKPAPEPESTPAAEAESPADDFDIDALFDTTQDETPAPAPVFEEPAPKAVPVVEYTPTQTDTAEEEALLNETAKSAAMGSLTKLAQNIAISRQPSGNTLEDVVRDMLRPMLKDWLDKNLPAIIERQVSRELEKMTKQAFRDE